MRFSPPTPIRIFLLFAFVLGISLIRTTAPAGAQVQQPDPVQQQIQDRDRLQDGQGDQTRQQFQIRLRTEIDEASGLGTQERQRLRDNLEACLQLGFSNADLATLFAGGGSSDADRGQLSVQTRLRLQERILAAARDGLPVDPMLDKVREGRIKGVAEPRLEQACDRMADHLQVARRVMDRIRQQEAAPGEGPAAEGRLIREMAQHLWRGLREDDLDHLADRARTRLRDGSCNPDDLAAAAETASRLKEEGIEAGRATRAMGEALERGYRLPQMRELAFMVTARHQQGGSIEDFMGDLEHGLQQGMGSGQMFQHMVQNGWMGPGDMHGPGGHNPIDDVGGGSPGHHGGHGEGGGPDDDGHHGGGSDDPGRGSQGGEQGGHMGQGGH